MWCHQFIWLSVVFVGLQICYVNSEKHVVCYYGTWATYRWGNGKFDIDNINTDLCTHAVYTFVGLNPDGTVAILDAYLDLPDNGGRDNFGKFTALKKKNPKLKTLLAVGGWNEGSAKYSTMAANPTLRQTFVDSALQLLLTHGFDGFDIDWEYPNQRDSVNHHADVDNFTTLLKELKEALSQHGLLLTIAVAAVKSSASLSYDVPAVAKHVDLIHLMTYDFYGAWDPTTGHNAGLHRGEGDAASDRDSLFTADVAVEYWLNAGCPPEKLVLGLPLYGRTFTLSDANVNGLRAPSSGAGIAGPYTITNGIIGYNEFCVELEKGTWETRRDHLAKVPYAVQGRNWVSYDDAQSLTAKVQYALSKGLGGAMVWSIETDDFHGLCGEDFPLLRAINRALGTDVDGMTPGATENTPVPETTPTTPSTPGLSSATESTSQSSCATKEIPSSTTPGLPTHSTSSGSSSTTAAPSPTTTKPSTPTTTTGSPISRLCKQEGLSSNPDDCSSFFFCVRNGNGQLEPIKFQCPKNLLWDQNVMVCNYANLVNCVN